MPRKPRMTKRDVAWTKQESDGTWWFFHWDPSVLSYRVQRAKSKHDAEYQAKRYRDRWLTDFQVYRKGKES